MSAIVIVGAGAQLGAAVGRRFAAEGFDVGLVARNRSALEVLAEDLSAAGTQVGVFPADVTDRPALCAALTAAEEHFGGIDVLEFSPGPSPADLSRSPLVEAAQVTVESILPHLAMYLLGGVAAIRQVLPGMLERGSGTVLVTSGAGSGPMIIPAVANVQVATAGLRNWILNLNASLQGRGVYAAHVAIAAYIGQGRPASEPAVIADVYWQMHTQRTQAEVFYNDMPGDGRYQGLSDRYATKATGGPSAPGLG